MVFGKPLSAQAVVRNRLARMISLVEACQNWLESITHQMNNVSQREHDTLCMNALAYTT